MFGMFKNSLFGNTEETEYKMLSSETKVRGVRTPVTHNFITAVCAYVRLCLAFDAHAATITHKSPDVKCNAPFSVCTNIVHALNNLCYNLFDTVMDFYSQPL